MVQSRNISKTSLPLGRMNIKIYEIGANLYKNCSNGISSVWEKALSAVLNCLYKRIFLNAAAVSKYKDFFFVGTAYSWFSDYYSKGPFRIFSAGSLTEFIKKL